VIATRLILGYVLIVFLCLLGFYLLGASMMAFFPPHAERNWQFIVIGIVFLSLGISVWVGANILSRTLRRK